MLQKFLLIGVGGSGGKTLRYTWRELDRRLKATGWTEGVPHGWRFLHIDVPELPDVVEGDVPAEMGPTAQYVGLARKPRRYREYDDDLIAKVELLPAVAGWRPDPKLDYSSPYKGAGQRRVVGRVVALTQLDQVGQALTAAVNAMANSEVDEQMARLNAALKADDAPVNAEPATAVVFSSLGGGAGSGMFLDVLELLMARRTEQSQWLADSLVTVLYAADVFSHLPPEARPGIEPNSIAAISELLSAYEHEGDLAELEDRLLDLGGGTASISGRRIGRTNFIIGARNESVAFATSSDVFRSVGKLFASFMTNPKVQRQFVTYIDTNPSAPTVTDVFAITDQDTANRPCSSFGYANVSLGRSLFAQYAGERLAKRAIERLLRGHRERTDDEYVRDEQLVAEIAESNKETFYSDCQLWEIGLDHNQVLDALRDSKRVGLDLDAVSKAVKAELKKGVKIKQAPKEWFSSLSKSFEGQTRTFLAQQRDQRNQSAKAWVEHIQKQVCRATAHHVGRYGIPVTVALLGMLDKQLVAAANELELEAAKSEQEEKGLLNRTQQLFSSIKDKVVTPQHRSFEEATKNRRDALEIRSEADLYMSTAELLRDFVGGVLPALRRALRSAETTLARAEVGEHRRLVGQWSSTVVPVHLRSAPNELLLVKESEFPEQLDGLLMKTTESSTADAAVTAALEEIVSGMWRAKHDDAHAETDQTLIACTEEWAPRNSAVRKPAASAGAASFRIELDPVMLLRRSEHWVRDRRGPVSQFVEETLAKWLSDAHVDAAARAERFGSTFAQAIRSARPLVSTNPDTYHMVHGDVPDVPRPIITPIPIDATHRARGRVEEALTGAGVPPDDLDRFFEPNANVNEVEISSFLSRSVHPIVFDSLFLPVHREWQLRSNAASRSQFWTFRRARSLPSFIPLSPTRQESAVRGWIVANLLGQVPRLAKPWSAGPLSIWTPRGWRRFPEHLLCGDVSVHDLVPAALLESLPLAMLSFASGQPSELAAYLRLIELGTLGGIQDGLPTPPEELHSWVQLGEVSPGEPGFDGAPDPPEGLAGPAGPGDEAFESRKRALLTTIDLYDKGYKARIAARPVTADTTLSLGPEWEIRDLVARASQSLMAVIGGIGPEPVEGSDGFGSFQGL
jgi:hypothetical protein